jgi:hypothetical protein
LTRLLLIVCATRFSLFFLSRYVVPFAVRWWATHTHKQRVGTHNTWIISCAVSSAHVQVGHGGRGKASSLSRRWISPLLAR